MVNLDALNPSQRKAVEQIHGPVLVIAGPGTGKTHLLTTRIEYILDSTDADPQNILCLTFTNAAAVEMRNRLQKKIGAAAYQVKICTFHSFAEWLLEEFPQTFQEKKQNRELADDLTKALVYREVIQSKKWKYFSPLWDEFTHQRDFLSAISKLKRENITPEKLREMIPVEKKFLEENPDNFYKKKYRKFEAGDWKPSARQKIDTKIEKMAELADLWEVYESALQKNGIYDFDDLILWAVTELKNNENLRLDLQEKFQWILTDEYQDTNSSQTQILWALTDFDTQPNLFAVGDDDQSIYRFQGASVENIIEFRSRFPKRIEISLDQNYRSAQNILNAAFAVVKKNIDRADPDRSLTAAGNNTQFSGNISKAIFGSRYSELNFIVEKIKFELENGTAPNDIAVLVRKNSEVLEVARTLPKFGIPVAAQIFKNIFDDPYVRQMILMLQIFTDPKYDEKVLELLHTPYFNIPAEALLKLSLERNQARTSILELLLVRDSQWESPTDTKNQQPNLFDAPTKTENIHSPLQSFLKFLTTSRKELWHCRPEVISEKLFYNSGMAHYLIQKKETESLAAVKKFLEWIHQQRQENISEILDRVELHEKLEIPVRPDPLPADKKSVNVITAHKSKGREFDVVFLPGLEDKKWGNPRSFGGMPLPHIFAEDHDANEDERRLFFVGLTRARKKIYCSYSETDFSGRDKNPSLFWHELPEENTVELPRNETEESAQKLLPSLMTSGKEILLTDGEKDILREKTQNFVWSASSLQTYLNCPRQFLFQRLYRFPRRPSDVPQLALGTALHEALERTQRQAASAGEISVGYLLKEFDRALRGQSLLDSQFEKFLTHGNEILTHYFEKNQESFFDKEALTEYNFGQHSPTLENIRITGKADRIEFLDSDKKQIALIDYKSGKTKPIKHGENYWRQLVFYDLLVRYSKPLNWEVMKTELRFLTADASGKLGTRELNVSDADRAEVIAELKDADQKLKNLEFPLVENPKQDADIDFWQNFGK